MRSTVALMLGLWLAGCQSTSAGEDWNTIVGSPWKLQSIEGQPVVPGTSFSLTAGGDNKLYGLAVNHYSARYRQTGATLKVEKIGATKKYLDSPAGVMAQESRYFRLLGQVDGWSLLTSGTRLQLSRQGRVLLAFTRAGS